MSGEKGFGGEIKLFICGSRLNRGSGHDGDAGKWELADYEDRKCQLWHLAKHVHNCVHEIVVIV